MKVKIALLILLISCQWGCTKNETSNSLSNYKIEQYLEKLGITNYKIEKHTDYKNNPTPLKFVNIDQGREFFEQLNNNYNNSFEGNIKRNYILKKEVNNEFLMEWLNRKVSSKFTLNNTEKNISAQSFDGTQYGADINEFVNTIDSEDFEYGGSNPCLEGAPVLSKMTLWIGHSVTFTYNKNNNGTFNVSNFGSSLKGFHPSTTWTHQNGIGGTTPNGNIYFTVNGQEHINLSIPGVGDVELTSTPIQIKGIFNPCSGNYSITVTQK